VGPAVHCPSGQVLWRRPITTRRGTPSCSKRHPLLGLGPVTPQHPLSTFPARCNLLTSTQQRPAITLPTLEPSNPQKPCPFHPPLVVFLLNVAIFLHTDAPLGLSILYNTLGGPFNELCRLFLVQSSTLEFTLHIYSGAIRSFPGPLAGYWTVHLSRECVGWPLIHVMMHIYVLSAGHGRTAAAWRISPA
jgi:hypothetical protein